MLEHRNVKITSAICALLLVVAGCATQNVPDISSYQLASGHTIDPMVETPIGKPAGTIVVKRDPGLMGAGLSSILLVDGKPMVRLKPGEYIEFRAAPGEHNFGVSWSDNLGPAATSSTRELAVDVRAGQTYYLRLFPQPGIGIAIERSSR